jgi:hypothetical protein
MPTTRIVELALLAVAAIAGTASVVVTLAARGHRVRLLAFAPALALAAAATVLFTAHDTSHGDTGVVPRAVAGKFASTAVAKVDPTAGNIRTASALLADTLRAPPAGDGTPIRLALDGEVIDAPVIAVGSDPRTGALDLPGDASIVGWYAPGSSPGRPGTTVIAGHVDLAGARGAFFGLRTVDPGHRVVVTTADGVAHTYLTVARRTYPKNELPTTDLFRADGPPRLVLVTCGGPFDAATHTYRDNIVVYAVSA